MNGGRDGSLRADQAGYQVLSGWVTPYHRWLKAACHHGRLTDFTLALMVAGPGQPLGTEVTEARVLQEGQNRGRCRHVDEVGCQSLPVGTPVDLGGGLPEFQWLTEHLGFNSLCRSSAMFKPTRTTGRCLFPCCFSADSKR